MVSNKPRRLTPTAHEKVWGSRILEPWFPNADRKIGEFWFVEEGSPILIKFLFTTENLSVQVHPNDQQAQHSGAGPRGKTEMWHILRAEPGAKLALGLTRDICAEELRRASADGSIMELLRWIPAVAGETWYIPAGTIHAIGAGITLCEVQQNSDVTYRMFDYGRPRELHLDIGVAASDLKQRPEPAGNSVESPYFRVEILMVDGATKISPGLVIAAEGVGIIEDEPFRAGEVWRVTADTEITSSGANIIMVS